MTPSVVIIAKNEEDRITACIESAKCVSDDIIVIISGSTDNTESIVKSLGAKLIQSDWKGFGPTKNLGHQYAKHEWILSMDSDEVISEGLIDSITNLDPKNDTVYSMNRLNIYLNKPIKHSGWYPDRVYRLFPKSSIEWNDNIVHEKLIIPDSYKTINLVGDLLHYSYRSLQDHKEKIEKYAELKARKWHDSGKRINIIKRMFGPLFKAIKSYVFRLGLLDGSQGLTIAKMNYRLIKRTIYYYDQIGD